MFYCIFQKWYVIFCPFSSSFSTDDDETATRLIQIEKDILQYDLDIKSSLQLSAADPTKCINVLENYKKLSITALMLKKNPNVVETIKRLRRYVGNMKNWNFTDEQRVEFDQKAQKVRTLSDNIYNNFKVIKSVNCFYQIFTFFFFFNIISQKLFNFPPNTQFWTEFTNEVNRFNVQTKHLSPAELIGLTQEPGN